MIDMSVKLRVIFLRAVDKGRYIMCIAKYKYISNVLYKCAEENVIDKLTLHCSAIAES